MISLVDKEDGEERVIGVNILDISCVMPLVDNIDKTVIYLISSPDNPLYVYLPSTEVLSKIATEEMDMRFGGTVIQNTSRCEERHSFKED